MRNKLLILFIIVFVAQIAYRVYSYRTEYFTKFDAAYWQERYLQSQWVVSYSKNPIGDDGLYAYAGWRYINGSDPTTLNAEVPPIGKYLIGLSILLFHNQNIFALFCGFLVLISLYLMNTVLFEDRLFAFLPVVLFSFEPLFYTQLRAPFLDLLYLGFFLLCVSFFLRENYIFSSFFLGFMAATKNSSSTFLLVIITVTLYLLVFKKFSKLKKFYLSLPIALFMLLMSYWRFFMLGHTLKDFLSVQKYILHFYTIGVKGSFFSPWQILLTGIWPTWFGGMQRVAEWHVGWAFFLILTVFYWFIVVIKYFPFSIFHFPFISNFANGLFAKKHQEMNFFAIWLFIYLLFLSFIPMFPRYLLLALPFLYNMAIWQIIMGIKSAKGTKNKKN